VGISYDLSAILKNGTLVKLAENKFIEAQNALTINSLKSQVQKNN
jgi:hypothetical protein